MILNLQSTKNIMRITKYWHRLPGEAEESPSLEIFKSHLDMALGYQT